MNVWFATNDPTEAETRMRAANGRLSDETITRIVALVRNGAVRVVDAHYHPAGGILPEPTATPDDLAELASIGVQAFAESRLIPPTKGSNE